MRRVVRSCSVSVLALWLVACGGDDEASSGCDAEDCPGDGELARGDQGPPGTPFTPDTSPGASGLSECVTGQRVLCEALSDESVCGFATCKDGAWDTSLCREPGIWYEDEDADGHGNPDGTKYEFCDPPSANDSRGLEPVGDDCDDEDGSRNPDVAEVCNDVDDDCDGTVDEGVKALYVLDCDGDGFAPADATNSNVSVCIDTLEPAADLCDEVRGTPQWIPGGDGLDVDCWDRDVRVYPGATEASDEPIAFGVGFDYDCSEAEETQIEACPAESAFETACAEDDAEGTRCFDTTAAACGVSADGLVCGCTIDDMGEKVCEAVSATFTQACR